MSQRSKVILISVLSVILGVVCLLTGRSLNKNIPVQGADPIPTPTVVAYDPTKEEGTAENPFTILEIVPNYSYAQIGYLIDGQEPVNVYGPGGMLELAQAGDKDAYEYLELLTEFKVSGPMGNLDIEVPGAGGGIGGGSRTIYSFEDEWSKYPEINEDEWVKSSEKINRVTGYYTEATPEELTDSGIMKYKLEAQLATGPNDTSGIDGEVHKANVVLNGFEPKTGGDYKSEWIQSSQYSGAHCLKPGTNGENLKRYKREEVTVQGNPWWTYTYFSYYRDDNGEYIYYNGAMYEKVSGNSSGSHIGIYSEGNCVYKMVEAGKNPTVTEGIYYYVHKEDKLGYIDNQDFADGNFYLGNTIWIEDEAYDGYADTVKENYYIYTPGEGVEEDADVFVFDDEKKFYSNANGTPVEWEEKESISRAGSYCVADALIRNDSVIRKYEALYQLSTETAGTGWIELGRYFKELTGFKKDASTEEEKYDKPVGFVEAVDGNDKGSDGLRYKQLAEEETDKIVGTKVDYRTYKKVETSWEFVKKTENWEGDTYNLDFKYVSAANRSDSGYELQDGVNSSELYFVTFSKTRGSDEKKYKAVVEDEYRLNGNTDNANRYFYEKNGSEYSSLVDEVGYGGDTNGEWTGIFIWREFDDNTNYLITFTQDDSVADPYYVEKAVLYSNTGITEIGKISSMLYKKENNYVLATGTSGQLIKRATAYHYEYDENGDYIYYNDRLYKKTEAAPYGNHVRYEAVAEQGDGTNYYYFNNAFYRKNPDGEYIAEYTFRKDASGNYTLWLRPVVQTYVNTNSGTTFYYWKGLSYADNLTYHSNATYKAQVKAEANWNLVETREESYFAKKKPVITEAPEEPEVTATPTPPMETIPTEGVTITHSNVFLKNVMNFAYQDNDPTKPLDIDQFEFGGWYTEKECINKYDFENSAFRSNSTLYAKWIPKTSDGIVFESDQYYTVKFFAKADATEPGYTLEYFKGELNLSMVSYIPAKAASATEEYAFLGWSTKKNGVEGDVLTDVSRTADTINLYPVWKTLTEEDIYTVNFNVTKAGGAEAEVVKTLKVYENGHIKTEDGTAVSDKYMKSMASFEPASQTGKKFVGWYAKENPEFPKDVPYNFEAPLKGDAEQPLELYACWVEEDALDDTMLTITYKGNEASVESLLRYNQKVEGDSFYPEVKYFAFKADGTFAETAENTVPRLKGNVQYKASQYKIEVKTVTPSDLKRLPNSALNALFDKADMIVVGNSNDTKYDTIFAEYSKYANKTGGTNGYTSGNDIDYRVAIALFKKSMEKDSAPVMLDKALLNCSKNLGAYKLFVMFQSMDVRMFYDSFLKQNATNATLWPRITSAGAFNGDASWSRDKFVTALGISDTEKKYYGIDTAVTDANFTAGDYPDSLTNHCYVYSGDVFKYGTELTREEITKNDFYTAGMFDYFKGAYPGDVLVKNKYAPADAVNYMVFGYEPEQSLDETTSFLEIQPSPTFEDVRFWYLYVKKYIPNYSGKMIIKSGNTADKEFYLGTAVKGNYANTLTIEQMSSAEFVGKICDLSGDYRLIYLGLKELSSTLTGNAEYMDQMVSNGAGGYYAYFHTGRQVNHIHRVYQGQLSSDGTDTISEFCYPGNDFTRVKCEALYEFCKTAGLPVVLDSRFYSGNNINTTLVDSSSYLYQMLINGSPTPTPTPIGGGGDAPIGLKDLLCCFKYGDKTKEAKLKELLNQPNLRIVCSGSDDIPPEYAISDSGVVSGYLNPNNETERVLEYTFDLQGDHAAEYDVRLFIDMNADGKYTEATEKLDSLVVYNNDTGRYLSKHDSMTAGYNYTVKRSISDYVGILPWKLEVFDKQKPALHDSITGMTAIKTTKLDDNGEYEKETLKILQICSGTSTSNEVLYKTTVLLPSIQDIIDAVDINKDRAMVTFTDIDGDGLVDMVDRDGDGQLLGDEVRDSNGDGKADIAGDGKDADGKWYADYTYDDFVKAGLTGAIESKLKGINTAGDVTYKFWIYLSRLEDFDVEITRVRQSDSNLDELDQKIMNNPLYLENFNMLVLGFADCYRDIENEATLRAIEDFIASGKSVLFTHDTTSLYNVPDGVAVDGYQPWGYNINRYFRNILGMDRFGVTITYNGKGDISDLKYKDKVYKVNSGQEQYVTVDEKELVQGYTSWEMWKNTTYRNGRGETNKFSQSATKVNDGQLTRYPYLVGDEIGVARTHSQYYQLDLDADDIVVWYCLSGDNYKYNYNDATNCYYIYNKGNITYSGVGHNGDLTDDELKLFVNTMVAAYAASADPTAPQIINFDRTTGTDKIDYLYVDYDATNPEEAIGDGVGVTEITDDAGNITSIPTKEVDFKLTENSIVTNKLMTLYVYDSVWNIKDDTVVKPQPMQMEVRKYTAEGPTPVPVNAIPVFIVTQGDTYGAKDEYKYEPGQIVAIYDYEISNDKSSCKVQIGNNEFTVNYIEGKNGYYASNVIEIRPQIAVKDDGTPEYSATDVVKGRVFMAPIVEAGEEYMFKAPINGLVDTDIIPYMLHVNLRYGKRQDKMQDGYKELSVVRRGLFNLD